MRPLHAPGPALPLSCRPPSLTLEVELLDGFPGGLVLALVVGQGGLLEHHPVLAVPLQSQFPGPEGVAGGSGQATSLPPSSLRTGPPSSRAAKAGSRPTGRSGDGP